MQIGYNAGMQLQQLRAFAMIVDAGGFAKAATQLHVSQPALSRQISALEKDLGTPLFDRQGHRVRLTAQGEDLLRLCRRVLSEVDALRERARAVKKGQSGVLRVGATPQVIEILLATFMLEFRESHPGVEVHLFEQGGARLAASLERGDVHLAILPAGDDRFRGKLLYPMHILAVLPKGHRLAKRRLIDVTELDDEPLFKLDNSFASHGWFSAACIVAHVSPRVLLESASPQTTIALAASGHGVAILPSAMRIASPGVCVIPVVYRRCAIGRWAMAAWNPRRYLPPFAGEFVEALVPRIQKVFPGSEYLKTAPLLARPKNPP
jgi:DNA-binding transcriptional LysR family regulator